MRVYIGRPQPRPLQGPVFVAQDPEGRHLAQPVAPEAPAGPGRGGGGEGAEKGGGGGEDGSRETRGHIRNSRSLPETTEGNRGTPGTIGQYRQQRGWGRGPARRGAELRARGAFPPWPPENRFHSVKIPATSASQALGIRTCEAGGGRGAELRLELDSQRLAQFSA